MAALSLSSFDSERLTSIATMKEAFEAAGADAGNESFIVALKSAGADMNTNPRLLGHVMAEEVETLISGTELPLLLRSQIRRVFEICRMTAGTLPTAAAVAQLPHVAHGTPYNRLAVMYKLACGCD